jgi:hypothetical protein
MSDETLRRKLFPFSLMGKAKQWYNQTIGSVQGDWETLCSKFFLQFLSISRVVSLQLEILYFKQHEEESLGISWDHFNDLINIGPDLAILDPILLQHFYIGLSEESRVSLHAASRGAFLHLSISEVRSMLKNISETTPFTSSHNKLPEKEKKSSLERVEEILITKSPPLQSQGLAINPKPSRPQKPPSKEECQHSKISCENKLSDDDFNLQFCMMLVDQYKSDFLEGHLLESIVNFLSLLEGIGKSARMACLVIS